MSAKRMLVKVIAGAVLVGGAWGQRALYAGDEATVPDSGTVVGILTAKEKSWVEVKEDGKKESRRYIAEWKGGSPQDGGGPDAAMVETIKNLRVSNRVRLEWKMDEHLRVLKIEMLIPEKKEGTVEGVVTALGDNWVEVTPAGGVPNRYWPRWIGGMPKDGGKLDQDMIRAIRALKVGDKVRIEWKYDERLRAVKLDRLETPAEN